MTATAAAGMLRAQDEGKDHYSTFVAPVIGEIFAYLCEIMQMHWHRIARHNGSQLGLKGYDDLLVRVRFQPTGKSSNSSPGALLQKLQMALELAQRPTSTLDYQSVEKQVMQALELPFDVTGMEKKGPSSEELMAILGGLLSGQVAPQEAAQILQEAHASITGQAGGVGLPQGGLGPVPPAGAIPGGSAAAAPGAISLPTAG
jgi:hypothetical protein